MTHLLIYGDSNTHGTLPMADIGAEGTLGPDDRWAGHLARGLGPGWRLTVEGLPGRTTVHDDPLNGAWKNGLAVLPAILESHAPADAVAMMLGTNDLQSRFSASAQEIALSMARLMECVARFVPEARRMMICPPPVREVGPFAETFAGAAVRAARLPAAMADVAGRLGVAFFDAGSAIGTDPLDGIHFGAEAHAALGRALVEPVRALA